MELERSMDKVNIENQRLQTMKEIYSALPLREFKVVNVGGEPQGGNVTMGGMLLPGLAASMMG